MILGTISGEFFIFIFYDMQGFNDINNIKYVLTEISKQSNYK